MKSVFDIKLWSWPASTSGLLALAAALLLGPIGTARSAETMLSDEDISKLQETSDDPVRKTSFQFSASAQAMTKTKTGRAIQRNGKIPFIVTCGLYEIKERKGKKFSQRLNGMVELRILDSDKKIIVSTSKSLEKMCPS